MIAEPPATVIWNHIDGSRRKRVFRGTRRDVSAATGVNFATVTRVMSAWKDLGAVEHVKGGCWRVNFTPPIILPARRDRWPDWAEDALRRLSAEGWSTTRIGKHIGFSNNAVCGKRHRLGLEKRPSPIRCREAA